MKLTETQRRAKKNILWAVTRFENKIGRSLKNCRVKWYVLNSLSSETPKTFPEALEEVITARRCKPCGYRVEFDTALASEIWVTCDDVCVMWSRL